MAYTFQSIRNFMRRNEFEEAEIRYIIRREERTVLQLMDGRELSTCIPLAYFESFLGSEDFTRINKKVLIANSQAVSVSGGCYLMTDGARLEGRHRNMKAHTDFLIKMAGTQQEGSERKNELIREKFQAFDNFPVPFCVIQLVFDPRGKSTSFIFRYCNELMGQLEQMPVDRIVNSSFYDIFENPDPKWLMLYGDVAKNGGIKIFRSHKEKLDKELVIVCYQVAPGYCGCLVMQEDWKSLLPQIVTNLD